MHIAAFVKWFGKLNRPASAICQYFVRKLVKKIEEKWKAETFHGKIETLKIKNLVLFLITPQLYMFEWQLYGLH